MARMTDELQRTDNKHNINNNNNNKKQPTEFVLPKHYLLW